LLLISLKKPSGFTVMTIRPPVRVTVCIATYNRCELLKNAINSVLAQSEQNFQLIIVNDNSTDQTDSIIDHFAKKDLRIKCITHETNNGLPSARNSAINIASGHYFSFLDDDDIWHKDFLREMILLANTCNEDSCFISGFYTAKNLAVIPYFDSMPLKEAIRYGYTPPVASQFYVTNTLKKIGGYSEEISTGVDHDLWLKLSKTDIVLVPLKMALTYPDSSVHNERMTTNYSKRLNGILKSLEYWRPALVENFGEKFFFHFENNYRAYLDFKFLVQFVGRRQPLRAAKILIFSSNKKWILKKILNKIIKTFWTNAKQNEFIELAPQFDKFRE